MGSSNGTLCKERPEYALAVSDKFETLCRNNPAFARIIEQVMDTNVRKAADYTHGGNPWSNFEEAAATAGTTVEMVLETMIATKCARLKALRIENKGPQNESVADTLLDRAVYSILAAAYALYKASVAVNDHFDEQVRPVIGIRSKPMDALSQPMTDWHKGQQCWVYVPTWGIIPGVVTEDTRDGVGHTSVEIRVGDANKVCVFEPYHVFTTRDEGTKYMRETGRHE